MHVTEYELVLYIVHQFLFLVSSMCTRYCFKHNRHGIWCGGGICSDTDKPYCCSCYCGGAVEKGAKKELDRTHTEKGGIIREKWHHWGGPSSRSEGHKWRSCCIWEGGAIPAAGWEDPRLLQCLCSADERGHVPGDQSLEQGDGAPLSDCQPREEGTW